MSRGNLLADCIGFGVRGGVRRGALELPGGSLDARTSPAAVSADARDLGGRGWDDARFCLRIFFRADLDSVAQAFENSMSLSSEGGSISISSDMVAAQLS
jgi:hypothetical protein